MSIRVLFSVCLGSVALAGCSSLLFNPVSAPKQASLSASFEGSGFQQFQCAVDQNGFYWRFIAPDVQIKDVNGHLYAKQGPDFAFTAADGSALRAKITASETSGSNSRMKDVLFEVSSQGNPTGKLSEFRWVKRTNATGGIPFASCRKENLGIFLKVPFRATYEFYK